MNAVVIDVSKGKSMVAVIRPFGKLVVKPYEVHHTFSELSELASTLKSLEGETRLCWNIPGGIMSLPPNCSTMPEFLSVRSIRCSSRNMGKERNQ